MIEGVKELSISLGPVMQKQYSMSGSKFYSVLGLVGLDSTNEEYGSSQQRPIQSRSSDRVISYVPLKLGRPKKKAHKRPSKRSDQLRPTTPTRSHLLRSVQRGIAKALPWRSEGGLDSRMGPSISGL